MDMGNFSKTCDTCRWAGCRHYGKADYGCHMWLMSHEEIKKREERTMDLKIFTDNIEEEALNQINTLLSQDAFKDCKVRIMPDVHAGAVCAYLISASPFCYFYSYHPLPPYKFFFFSFFASFLCLRSSQNTSSVG